MKKLLLLVICVALLLMLTAAASVSATASVKQEDPMQVLRARGQCIRDLDYPLFSEENIKLYWKWSVRGKQERQVLLQGLQHEDVFVRRGAAYTLVERAGVLGPDVVPHLLKALDDEDGFVRLFAVLAIEEAKADPTAVVASLQRLLKKEGNPRVLAAVHGALAVFGDNPRLHILELVKYARYPLSVTAHRQLWRLRPEARKLVPELLKKLGDRTQKWNERDNIACALGSIGGKDVVRVLSEIFGNPEEDEGLRRTAAWSIGTLANQMSAKEVDMVVPVVVTILGQKDKSLAKSAAWVCITLGPRAKVAAPSLVRWLGKERFDNEFISALAAIGKPAVRNLISALKSEVPLVRDHAVEAIGEIGPAAEEAVPAIVKVLGDALPLVEEDYTKPEWDVHAGICRLAARALGNIGPKAAPAVPILIKALESSRVQDEAAIALGAIGPAAQQAVPALIEELKKSLVSTKKLRLDLGVYEFNGKAAIWALGRIGPKAKPAVPLLKEALKLPRPEIRKLADWALKRISGEEGAKTESLEGKNSE